MNRIDIINKSIKENNYQSYLEIGCDADWCFNQIIAPYKVGVDPQSGGTVRMTSDDFFFQNTEMFDIIFIDGLHHADQVLKDVENALKVLNPEGIIVMHDINPLDEFMQTIPVLYARAWTGDVWKAWVTLRSTRADLEMYTLILDGDLVGVGIVKRGSQELLKIDVPLTYENLDKNRQLWLNIQ